MFENIRTILVPIDFSAASRTSLQLAANLARCHTASIHLLYVYEEVFSVLSMRTFDLTEEVVDAGIRTELEKKFDAFLQNTTIEVPLTHELRRGDITDEILDCAKSIDADVIVIATNAKSGLEHLFIGSIAQRVVRSATIPVITFRSGAAG